MIECRQSVLIDQSIMNTFIHVFRRISTEHTFLIKKIEKLSEISEINMPDSNLHGSLIKKLSISVAELSVILVGLLLIGRSDSEYIVFRNEVEVAAIVKKIAIKITAQDKIMNLPLINSRENILNTIHKNIAIS